MDTKNSLGKWTLNILMTFIWLFSVSVTYHNWASANTEQIVVILLSTVFLYWFTIHPTIKVWLGTATGGELEFVIFFPLLGLLRKQWSPYQRMARKLANEEAIRWCEDALEKMHYTGGNPNPFKDGRGQFRECFPKIISMGTNKRKFELMKSVLSAEINHRRIKLERVYRMSFEGIKSRFVLDSMENLADFLIKEAEMTAMCPNRNVGQQFFARELAECTETLVTLQDELDETNSDEIFKKLFDI